MPVVGGFKHALVSDGTGLNVDNSTLADVRYGSGADMCSAVQRKIRIVPSENPDFLQAWRLRTRLLVMVEVGDQSLTNAEVYFQQSAARNKPNAWTFHRGAVANNSLQSSN